MPKKAVNQPTGTVTVTLSTIAIAMLEELVQNGLHGGSRAEAARSLILDRLEDLAAKRLVTQPEPDAQA
jgi:hypothetical protein